MNLTLAGASAARPSTLASIEQRQFKQKPTVANSGLADKYAVTMHLLGHPTSSIASLAISTLATEIYQGRGRKRRPSVEYLDALGAAVADLLTAVSHNPPWPCRRRMGLSDFTGSKIGYRPALRVIEDLTRRGFVEFVRGNQTFAGKQGYISRVVPTALFIERVTSLGINPADRLAHFAYHRAPLPSLPVRLVEGNRRGDRWERIKGKRLPIDTGDPVVQSIIARMKALNAFYVEHSITLDQGRLSAKHQDLMLPENLSFFRGFNNGDDEPYGWNQGGRLYAHDGHFQMIPKRCRSAILIDGQPTGEVDISACYLTLAYALLGIPMPATDDLYTVPGIDREVVKMFVNTTLSAGKPIGRWSSDHCERYLEATGKRIGNDYRLSDITPVIMDSIPVIGMANRAGLSWADLLYNESEIVLNAVCSLAFKQRACALPMHDAIITPIACIDLAKDVLRSSFSSRMGIYPILKVSI